MIDDILSELIKDLKEFYRDRFVNLILFGSYAREKQHTDSDIDLLLVLKGDVDQVEEIRRVTEVVYNHILKFDILISVIPVSIQDYELRDMPLYHNIREEGVLIGWN